MVTEVSMSRPLIVFEDDKVTRLYPLTLTRPVSDLRCGAVMLKEKIRFHLIEAVKDEGVDVEWFGAGEDPDIRFHLRDHLMAGCGGAVDSYEDLFAEHDIITLINGRVIFDQGLVKALEPGWQGAYLCGDDVVLANVTKGWARQLERHIGRVLHGTLFTDLPARQIEARLIGYPWELVGSNGNEIARDFDLIGGAAVRSEPGAMVYVLGREQVRIGKGVKLAPGVVIDATQGPVIIDDDVVVMANASLEGPLHIGRGSILKMGAKLYGETSIGPVCKIGGEVAESIFQGYSNKQHEGFVGHSYLGEWVNIGAGTDTSDMKNNYSNVRVPIDGEPVDSGRQFVGLFMGDHSKSGIGTVFNTGTVIGVCSNVYGADYPPKYIPSFTWGGASGFVEYRLDRAIDTARRAMARRGRDLGQPGEALLRRVFEMTAAGRHAFLVG
jgi:UDP-N-acetylglucosamine diphosphorylase/glucosamine-1-phosphate N-acetyltransferase